MFFKLSVQQFAVNLCVIFNERWRHVIAFFMEYTIIGKYTSFFYYLLLIRREPVKILLVWCIRMFHNTLQPGNRIVSFKTSVFNCRRTVLLIVLEEYLDISPLNLPTARILLRLHRQWVYKHNVIHISECIFRFSVINWHLLVIKWESGQVGRLMSQYACRFKRTVCVYSFRVPKVTLKVIN